MSAFRVTWSRTVGQARNLYVTALTVGLFLAVAVARFAFLLEDAEGGRLSLSAVWALSVSPLLPFLAAFLAMDVWSEERRTGRVVFLLSTSVSEDACAWGKFFGVWTAFFLTLFGNLILSLSLLQVYAPLVIFDIPSLVMAFGGLLLQGAFWCAFSVAASAACRHGAISALISILVLSALPRGIWWALQSLSSSGSAAYGEMPIDAQIVDFASGLVPLGTVFAYVFLTGIAVFLSARFISALRLVGRNASGRRFSLSVVILLSLLLSGLVVSLCMRMPAVVELPVAGAARLSPRTLGILSETHDEIYATCFLPRSDARYRDAARTLRVLARAAVAQGGARFIVRYVDPRWDVAEAARLVREGAKPGSIIFSCGRRQVSMLLGEGLDERQCASLLLRLITPPQRRHVRWTRGHGEFSFDDYGPYGMSDIAREFALDGYLNAPIDLLSESRIPADCALIVVAGAREDFSREELSRLDSYLRQGGRLLVLINANEAGGVRTLLSSWGLNVSGVALKPAHSRTGSDAVVTTFSDHPVVAPLRGSRILLNQPVILLPSAAIAGKTSADAIGFTGLASIEGAYVAAALERGTHSGNDITLRPTRVIVIGDARFALNGQLAAAANANRDFLLNAVAFLSGTDAMTSSGADGSRLVTGIDRATRGRFLVVGAAVVPVGVALFLFLIAFRRRHRK